MPNGINKKPKSEPKKLIKKEIVAEDLSKAELRQLAASCFDSLREKLTGVKPKKVFTLKS